MVHLGDESGNDGNLIEVSLPLSLSAGVLYIIQRFLNQVDDREINEEELQGEREGVVEVNLQVEEFDEVEERNDESPPIVGEGDMQNREIREDSPTVGQNRRLRTKRYRTPWTKIRRSLTPDFRILQSESFNRSNSDNSSPQNRTRSRSPIGRDSRPPPNEN